MIVDPGRVAAHIELEHAQRIGRRLGDAFEAGIADRTQHMGTPNSPAALTTGAAPSGWKLSSEPTGHSTTGSRSLRPRSSVEASTLLTSRSTRGRNAMSIERHAVSPQRRLGLDAADDVIPGILIEILPRLGDDLVQIEEFIALIGRLQKCGFVQFLIGHFGDTRCWLRGQSRGF